jgi:DNA primase
VPRQAADLAWMANLACLELHPHPVRAEDLEHPDELRIDLDPVADVPWSHVREVARVVQTALEDHGLCGWPKTSGKRGLHVLVRIDHKWTHDQVRRAALALARDVEQRVPTLATSKWWKEERHGVFIDYNQNAKDRTVAGAYAIRPTPDARGSAPLGWSEVADADPADFTMVTMLKRFASLGDLHREIDAHAFSLDSLLELSQKHERDGQGDAPWPPQYAKAPGEPKRVQPSRRAGARAASRGGDANAATRGTDGSAASRDSAAATERVRPRKPSSTRKAS